MDKQEWSKISRNPRLDVEIAHLFFKKSAFSLHMHDHYVIGLIDSGVQSFKYRKQRYVTPPDGLIVLNPGDAHTGEPAGQAGFRYRALYPTASHMRRAAIELTGRDDGLPVFRSVRVDDRALARLFRATHSWLLADSSPLQYESAFVLLLAEFIKRHAELAPPDNRPAREHRAIAGVKNYIQENWRNKLTLTELADLTHLSRYHLLRTFCAEVGMPPHVYQESIRMNHARDLLKSGAAINRVALESGFSDQSHFTNRFRRFLGVAPGKYVTNCTLGG